MAERPKASNKKGTYNVLLAFLVNWYDEEIKFMFLK